MQGKKPLQSVGCAKGVAVIRQNAAGRPRTDSHDSIPLSKLHRRILYTPLEQATAPRVGVMTADPIIEVEGAKCLTICPTGMKHLNCYFENSTL